MRLKRRAEDAVFDWRTCAAARCREPAEITEATRRLAPVDVPLCQAHWLRASDRLAEEANRTSVAPYHLEAGEDPGLLL